MMTSSISPIKDVEEAYEQVLQAGADIALTRVFGTDVGGALRLAERAMTTMDAASEATGIKGIVKKAAAFTMGVATGWEARERHRNRLKAAEHDVSKEEAIDPDSFRDELTVLILRLNNWMGSTVHPFIPQEGEMKDEDLKRTEEGRLCMAEAGQSLRRAETAAFLRVAMLMPEDQRNSLLERGLKHYPDLREVLQSLLAHMEQEQ